MYCVQFSRSVCLTLCDPMDCSMPGLPVLHHHPELAQFVSIESVMPSSHLILCHPLLLLPSILPSIRVFSNESALHIKWPKYWCFSISSSNEYSGLISLLSKGLLRVFSSTTVQKHQFWAPSLPHGPTLTSIHDYWKNHSFD